MDAETRHQLKTNELGELLERLRDFNNPYVKYPLMIIGALIVVWIGWSSFSYFHRHGLELTWQKLADVERQLDPNDANYASAVTGLQRLANESTDPALFAATRIRLARVRYDEAVRMPTERAAKLGEAKSLLAEVHANSSVPLALEAAALFALATTHESLSETGERQSNLAEARKLYEELSTQPRFSGSAFVSLAKERLGSLDALGASISFVPGMAPTPIPVAPPPSPDGATPGPKISVGDGTNLQQLTPQEVEELLGKINAANPQDGAATPPPAGETPPPTEPAPATPSPAEPAPQPAPAPQPENPPPGGE